MDSLEIFSNKELLLDFSDMEYREFGFSIFNKFNRKIKFENKEKLVRYLQIVRPKDCFVSNARYSDPCSMAGFIGCDLFFDLDTEDNNFQIIYPDVLLSLKALKNDFGFKDIIVNKSGFKGYHVIVSDECVQDLKPMERNEIVDYLKIKYKIKSIDVLCTCDIHRLRRLEGTINSKSNSLCKRLIIEKKDV